MHFPTKLILSFSKPVLLRKLYNVTIHKLVSSVKSKSKSKRKGKRKFKKSKKQSTVKYL